VPSVEFEKEDSRSKTLKSVPNILFIDSEMKPAYLKYARSPRLDTRLKSR